jgi:hypothetical protein
MSEWIKTETHIHEKVEVAAIAEHTGLDPDAVVGKLVRVWSWASRNCYADGVTDVTALRVIRAFPLLLLRLSYAPSVTKT